MQNISNRSQRVREWWACYVSRRWKFLASELPVDVLLDVIAMHFISNWSKLLTRRSRIYQCPRDKHFPPSSLAYWETERATANYLSCNKCGWPKITQIRCALSTLVLKRSAYPQIWKLLILANSTQADLWLKISFNKMVFPKCDCHLIISWLRQKNFFHFLGGVLNVVVVFHMLLWYFACLLKNGY